MYVLFVEGCILHTHCSLCSVSKLFKCLNKTYTKEWMKIHDVNYWSVTNFAENSQTVFLRIWCLTLSILCKSVWWKWSCTEGLIFSFLVIFKSFHSCVLQTCFPNVFFVTLPHVHLLQMQIHCCRCRSTVA